MRNKLLRSLCKEASLLLDSLSHVSFFLTSNYANGGRDPEKLKWWNWKDEEKK